MRTLIIDMSPILYSNLFSASSEAQKSGLKPIKEDQYDCPKLPFEYEDILIYKIFEELSMMKSQFQVQEIVLGFDNSKGGYWRKKVYDRYKYARKGTRDDSPIRWDKAFEAFERIKSVLKLDTSFKTIDIPSVEGDDILMVLSKTLGDQGKDVIIHSLDHDLFYCTEHKNVSYFRTRKTQRLPGHYVEPSKEELLDMRAEHCIIGDKNDGFLHVKAWTQFSPDFVAKYPKYTGKELELWSKHHEIDTKFKDKHGVSAYKQPRFGWKSYLKSGKSVQELLDENPIHKLNYDLNKSLGLPEGIPENIQDSIIEEYNNADDTRHGKDLTKYFMDNHMFELTSKIMNF